MKNSTLSVRMMPVKTISSKHRCRARRAAGSPLGCCSGGRQGNSAEASKIAGTTIYPRICPKRPMLISLVLRQVTAGLPSGKIMLLLPAASRKSLR